MVGLQLLWYSTYDETTRAFKGDLTPRIVPGSLRFSTKIHGGFDQCSFVLETPLVESWRWLYERHHQHLEVVDHLLETRYEGRIVAVNLDPRGVALTAEGYGVGATRDQVYSYSGEAAWGISDVITDALDNQCPDLDTSRDEIASNSLDVPDDWDFDEYPLDVFAQLCAKGDSSGDAEYCFAVWEDRVPYYWKKDTSTADWVVDRQMVAPGGLAIGRSDSDVWTRVKARYVDPDAAIAETYSTGWSTDYTGPLGSTQRDRVLSVGYAGQTSAEKARDLYLAERAVSRLRIGLNLGPWVSDRFGNLRPSWAIRAGDVVDISDLAALEAAIGVSESWEGRLFVTGTSWDGIRMTVIPDLEPDLAAIFMEQLGGIRWI